MDYSEAIIDIYSAPGSSETWDAALASLCDKFRAKGGVYLLINKQDQWFELNNWYGYSKEDAHRYLMEGGAATDARFRYIGNIGPGQVVRDMDFVPGRDSWDACAWNQYESQNVVRWGRPAAMHASRSSTE